MYKSPLVSVVIPTYKSADMIERCVRSVHDNTYKNIELIVVDSCSNDGTREIVQKYNKSKFIEKKSSRTEARNIGINAAEGKYIFNIDVDMELSRNLIEECVEICEKGYDTLIVPEENVANTFWTKCTKFGKQMDIDEPDFEYCRFVKRDLLIMINGYDESLVAGEDADVHIRLVNLGVEMSRTTSIIYHHVENISFFKIIKKSNYYAQTISNFHEKNMQDIIKRRSLVSVAIDKKHLFREDLIHGIGWIILTAVIFATTIKYNINYYKRRFNI